MEGWELPQPDDTKAKALKAAELKRRSGPQATLSLSLPKPLLAGAVAEAGVGSFIISMFGPDASH
jgi:hypothetical protein